MKKIKEFKGALVLFTVCIISALLLAIVHISTKDFINENNIKNLNKNLSEIFVGEYEKETINDENIIEIYKVSDNNKIKGYIYNVSSKCQYGVMNLLIGLNVDGTLKDIKFLINEHSYGTDAKKHGIENYHSNMDKSQIEEVDVKCGATTSAKEIKKMIMLCIDYQLKGDVNE